MGFGVSISTTCLIGMFFISASVSMKYADIAVVIDLASMNGNEPSERSVNALSSFAMPIQSDFEFGPSYDKTRIAFVILSNNETIVELTLEQSSNETFVYEYTRRIDDDKVAENGTSRNVSEAMVDAIARVVFNESNDDRPVVPNVIVWVALLPPPNKTDLSGAGAHPNWDPEAEATSDSILNAGADVAVVISSYFYSTGGAPSIVQTAQFSNKTTFGSRAGEVTVSAVYDLLASCNSSVSQSPCYFDTTQRCVHHTEYDPITAPKNKYCSDGRGEPFGFCPNATCRETCSNVAHEYSECSVSCGPGTRTKTVDITDEKMKIFENCPPIVEACDNGPCSTSSETTATPSDSTSQQTGGPSPFPSWGIATIVLVFLVVLIICVTVIVLWHAKRAKNAKNTGPALPPPRDTDPNKSAIRYFPGGVSFSSQWSSSPTTSSAKSSASVSKTSASRTSAPSVLKSAIKKHIK